MMKTILSVLLKYTNWIAILFSVFLTLYIIKPFLNGLGCNFELYDYNERINYSLTCKKGVIYNDVWDKETGEKYIKKSLYGYWGGYTYNIDLGTKVTLSDVDLDVENSGLSIYHLSKIWSAFSRSNDENTYSMVEIPRGAIFKSDFDDHPKKGFVE